jgi:hypothetical protein
MVRLFAALLCLAGAAPQDDAVKKIVPDAERVKRLPRKISKESQARIEKALGEKLADADLAPAIWECWSVVPAVSAADRTRCLVTTLTVKGPKGAVRVGVAAAIPENTLHAVKILENADDKGLEAHGFLAQFQGFEYSANVWNSPEQLAAALKAAGSAGEAGSLHRVNRAMRAVGPLWERLIGKIGKKDAGAAQDAAAIGKLFDEADAALGGLKALSALQQEKYKGYASDAKRSLAELQRLLGGAKFDEAQRKTGEIDSASCAKCHGAYRRRLRDARPAVNLGNGIFSTQVEVVVPDAGLDAAAQAVATGIRKAVLLLAEAK